MIYRNIVVGLDSSEYSEAALVEVASWAKKNGGHLSLVHSVYFDSEEFAISPSSIDKRVESGMELCSRVRDSFSSEFGVDMECIVRQGEAHDVIVEAAEDKKADLIAMGTHGRRGLRRMIMGSVTSGVILDSPCDVLVVKKAHIPKEGRYGSILVPYDGSELSNKALNRAVELKKEDPDAMVTLLYVIPRYEEMVGFFKTNSIMEKLYEEARKIVLEGLGIAQKSGILASTIVEEGHPSDKVIEIANGLGIDLIVMGSHGWRGFNKALLGSTAERVITHSTVPVLIAR